MNRCCICKKNKDIKCFHKNKQKHNGLSDVCISCAKAIRARSYQKHKTKISQKKKAFRKQMREYIDQKYKSGPCTDCGNCYHPECMDFDHIDPSQKKDKVSNMISYGTLEMIEAEIKKCELLCANCHRLRTHYRRLTAKLIARHPE